MSICHARSLHGVMDTHRQWRHLANRFLGWYTRSEHSAIRPLSTYPPQVTVFWIIPWTTPQQIVSFNNMNAPAFVLVNFLIVHEVISIPSLLQRFRRIKFRRTNIRSILHILFSSYYSRCISLFIRRQRRTSLPRARYWTCKLAHRPHKNVERAYFEGVMNRTT